MCAFCIAVVENENADACMPKAVATPASKTPWHLVKALCHFIWMLPKYGLERSRSGNNNVSTKYYCCSIWAEKTTYLSLKWVQQTPCFEGEILKEKDSEAFR